MENIMSININASAIINNLITNNYYQFSSTKRSVKFNEDADATRSNASEFRHALKMLKQMDTTNGVGVNIKNKIEDFVDTYNNFMTSSSAITGSKKLDKYMKKMDSLFDKYEDELKSIGITRSANKKLKFDKTNFSEVTSAQIEAVFGKDKSFLSDAIKYTKSIANIAEESLNTPVNTLTTTTIALSAANSALAQSGSGLAATTKMLSNAEYTIDNQNILVSYLNNFVTNYNQTHTNAQSATLNSTENSYISLMQSATSNASASLICIGITANADGSLSFDEAIASSADIATIESLFGSSASSYGSVINNYSEKLFASLVKADSSGLNINYYA